MGFSLLHFTLDSTLYAILRELIQRSIGMAYKVSHVIDMSEQTQLPIVVSSYFVKKLTHAPCQFISTAFE